NLGFTLMKPSFFVSYLPKPLFIYCLIFLFIDIVNG
ncbi:putative membrane protein, partial [Chlamydia psittaci 02DC14]